MAMFNELMAQRYVPDMYDQEPERRKKYSFEMPEEFKQDLLSRYYGNNPSNPQTTMGEPIPSNAPNYLASMTSLPGAGSRRELIEENLKKKGFLKKDPEGGANIPSEDEKKLAEQEVIAQSDMDRGEDYRKKMLMLGLGQAGSKIGSSIAGVKDDTSFYDQMRGVVGKEEAQRLAKKEKEEDKKYKERLLKEQMEFKKQEAEKERKAKEKYYNLMNKGTSAGLTPAQKKVDQTFAKDYADYYATGGRAKLESNLRKVEEAAKALESGEAKSGILIGMVPEWDATRGFIPDSVANRQKALLAVQASLKQTLGGQFTEREAKQLFDRTYDMSLPEKENIRKLKDLVREIRTMADAKERAGKYYEKTGTLAGFEATAPMSNPYLKPPKEAVASKSTISQDTMARMMKDLNDPNTPPEVKERINRILSRQEMAGR